MQHRIQCVDAKSRVRLPRQFAGRAVMVTSIGNAEVQILLLPTKRTRPSLEELLNKVPEGYQPDEIDFGPAVGSEMI